MATAVESWNTFRREHKPDGHREPITWICADERHPKQALGIGAAALQNELRNARTSLYKQTIAGAYGIGEDMHIALRMARYRNAMHNKDVRDVSAYIAEHMDQTNSSKSKKHDIPNATVLGSIAAKTAQRFRQGTGSKPRTAHLLMHEGCAGEVGAENIGWGIATNTGPEGQDVYETIKHMYVKDGKATVFPRERFNHISAMWREGLEDEMNKMMLDVQTSQDLLNHGGTHGSHSIEPIGRVPLVKMDHIGHNMLVNWEPGTSFDTQAAVEASDPANGQVWASYISSMGDRPELADIVTAPFPGIDPQDFVDAAFVRDTASSLWLPKQNDQAPQLHLVGADA